MLEQRRAATGRALYYFGLTGPEMHDIIDWRDLLQRDVTAVEELSDQSVDNLGRLIDVADAHDINVEVLRGKIEDVITSGRSIDNEPPRRASLERNGALRLSYDVVNLDFDGGLVILGRHRAVEALLRAQAHTPFTLLITYNVRHRLHKAIAAELVNLRQQVGPENAGVFDWYDVPGRAEAIRLKAVVPAVISHAAATALLDCRPYPPIRYTGIRGATLVHFVFDLTPRPDVFRAFHAGMRELVTMPLIDMKNGALTVALEQDPAFTFARCDEQLSFLPLATRQSLLASVPLDRGPH